MRPSWQRFVPPPEDLVLARTIVLRALGFVYLVAFLTFALQWRGLLGSTGLTPVETYLMEERGALPVWDAFRQMPTVFWLDASDAALFVVGWSGVLLSFTVLVGFGNAPILWLLWALYLSIVHVGQTWYSFGWEMQLL
jgi:hypothetical protein